MIHFVLLAAAVTGAPTVEQARTPEIAEKAADNRDKVICKRFLRTGSLVGGYRECKPKWQWERERENLRQLNTSDSCRDRANGGALCN